MTADTTRHLWLGMLAPSLRFLDNDGVTKDVRKFLGRLSVQQVIPERNGTRIGTFVLLDEPINRAKFKNLAGALTAEKV